MDRIEISGRGAFEGLIESEDDAWIHLIQIQRPPGQRMHLVIRPMERRQTTSVARTGPQDRAKLRQLVEQFRNRAEIEAGRMDAVVLAPVQSEGIACQRYQGRWFILDSTLDEQATRRLVVHAEQIFAAYRQILPARASPPQAPRLVVVDSLGEYHAQLARRGLKIDNLACFIEQQNVVLVACELSGLHQRLLGIRKENDRLREELRRREKRLPAELNELAKNLKRAALPGDDIKRSLQQKSRAVKEAIEQDRANRDRIDRKNQEQFDEARRQFFNRLYHESFHAYLENYVYPHRKHHVPYWLNEGMAMMCERGVLEGNTLRVDAPNSEMLEKLQSELRRGTALPLERVLTAGAREFLPRGNAPAADTYYAHAWGLVYYLAIETRRLDSAALDQYVRLEAKDLPPSRRFEEMIGMPLSQFEDEWKQAMLRRR